MAKTTYIDELKLVANAVGFSGAQKALLAVTTAMGSASALALKAGGEWDAATKTIVEGTGATGEQLDSLQGSFQEVAKWGPGAATAIADLNTHLGLTGPALEAVAEAALKAKVDTNLFGDVAAQMGLDAQGAATLLDQLTVASQQTGVDVDLMTKSIGRNSARWQVAGGDVSDLTALVVQLADEFGPSGIRGAMTEVFEEVDKGVIPAFQSLETQLGDTTGAVERTYEAGRSYRDTLAEIARGAMAAVGPHGDLIGAVGTFATTAMGFLTAFPAAAGAVATGARVMWGALTGPIGLAAAGIAALVTVWALWGDEITGFLKGAWNSFLGAIEKGLTKIAPLAAAIGIDLPTDLGSWKFALEESTEAQGDSNAALEAAVTAAGDAAGGIDTASTATGTLAGAMREAAAAEKETEATTKLLVGTLDNAAYSLNYTATRFEQIPPAVAGWNAEVRESIGLVPTLAGEFGGLVHALDPGGFVPVAQQWSSAAAREMVDAGDEVAAEFSGSFFRTLSRSFEGGGGFMGALKSSISEGFGNLFAEGGALSGVADKWGQAMSAIGGIPIVGPFLQAFGPAILGGVMAIGKKVWGKLKGMFGGPSEVVVAARETMATYAGTIDADTLNQDRLRDWVEGGFTVDHAKIVTQFQDLAEAAGEGTQAGVDLWLDYQKAVEDGNQAAIDAVMAQIEAWGGNVEAIDAAAAAAAEHKAAIDGIKDELLGLPTKEAIADFELLREAWAAMSPDEQAAALENYIAALEQAQAAGIALSEAELAMLDAVKARQAEIELVKEQQAAALDAVKERQAAELEALETARTEKLDMLRAAQDEALNLMREAQKRELDELKAAQRAELDELKAARQAALSVVEQAIQRELEEERIKVRLRLDLQAAGSDEEAQAAAHARAAESEARLADNRAMSAAMEEAEARIRERHQAEIDAINEKWDEKEALVTTRHETEVSELESHHEATLASEEEYWTESIAEWTHHFDVEKLPLLKAKHAEELTELEAHHAAELAKVTAAGDAMVAEALSTVNEINATTDLLEDRTVTITTVHRTVGATGGGAAGGGSAGGSGWVPFGGEMAAGGAGVVTRPTLFLAGEAGREGFWFSGNRGQVAPPRAAGGGGPTEIRLSGDDVLDLIAGRLVRILPREEARLAR